MDAPAQTPPPPSPTRAGAWSQRRKVITGLVALALAAGGGVAIADTSSPAPEVSRATTKDVTMGTPGMGLAKLGVARGMVHGEFTVPDGENGYRTVLTQNGIVESVNGSTLTVKSADGWSKSYTLDTATRIGGERFWSSESSGGLTQGQQVTVMATVKDGNAHADHVRTQLDKAELEKRGMNRKFDLDEMKGRMMERGGPGDRMLKLRGGPEGGFPVPAPGMEGEMTVQPAPAAEAVPAQ